MKRLVADFGWEALLVVLIVLAALWSSTLSPYFLDPVNLFSSAQFFVIFALMSFGLFPVIVQGEIDISLASTLAVSSVMLARLSVDGMSFPLALALVLVACGLLGAVNGVLVAVAGLPSLAVTLGTLGAYRGLAYIMSGDAGITGVTPQYVSLGSSWIGIVPVAVVMVLVVAAAFAVLMSATRFGRTSYAIGNNARAARMAGVPVAATKVLAYALAGVMSGLAGLVWVAQYQSARGDNADGSILFVITAVVLGGVSIKGGSGRALGVLLAIVLLGTLQTGMKLANVPGTRQTLVIGALLVGSIGIPRAARLLTGAVRDQEALGPVVISAASAALPSTRRVDMNSTHRRGRRLAARIGAAMVVSILTLAGCSSEAPKSSSGSGAGSSETKIFMAPKFTGLAYFEVARKGGEEAAADLKFDFKYIGSDKPEATEQIATLTNAIPQKPNALVVSAIDGDAVSPALKKARDQGIKVVTYDADAAVDARDLFVNQLSYELAAKTMLDAALMNSPLGGQVAFISASPNAPNHTAHVKIMKQLIDTDPKYKKLSYIDTVQFAGDDAQKSQEIALNLIQANPKLKVIISSSAVSAPAAEQAIVNAGLQKKVSATGFALPSSVKEFLKKGDSKAFALWDPAELGYIATAAAYQLSKGEITAEEGQVVDAGKHGKYTLGKDGEVQYNKPLIFTKDNVDEFTF